MSASSAVSSKGTAARLVPPNTSSTMRSSVVISRNVDPIGTSVRMPSLAQYRFGHALASLIDTAAWRRDECAAVRQNPVASVPPLSYRGGMARGRHLAYAVTVIMLCGAGAAVAVYWSRIHTAVPREALLTLARGGTVADVQSVFGQPESVFTGRARPSWLYTWPQRPARLCRALIIFDPTGSRVDSIDVWEDDRPLVSLRRSLPPEPIEASPCVS